MRKCLRGFDLTGLLVEELGWNHHSGSAVAVAVGERRFRAVPVAEKKGFMVWRCESNDGRIPDHATRRQVDTRITERAFEHMIVFVDGARREQVWHWIRREQSKPDASREYTFRAGQTGEPVLQRLQNLAFGLDEEESLTISLVADRVRSALNAEKVTKRFYEHYQDELNAFQRLIVGIDRSDAVDWYASLMLNRLMFIYFIQKRGFLDGDPNYLRTRLDRVRRARGPDRFHDFYRSFLRRLFHEGLGTPESERAPELAALLGEVPFLNGGIFDVHDLERDNPDISIPDAAFARLFNFFDRYSWHLDERPHAKDNEINPDVLGHIFEKSINQKEKGAYYTKEDITGYMAENTIIPRLLDMAVHRQRNILSIGWLKQDPDRYIRPPVGHGFAWDARDIENPVRVDPPLELPPEVAAGIGDPANRTDWDRPAATEGGPLLEYAHPRETWRQVVARRERYVETREKLAAGDVRDSSDLVTLNLDAKRLILDAIERADDPELVLAIWRAATEISILDPTCGSGAFLFAALRVLEPVYAACLARMRDLRPTDAEGTLAELAQHPSERYFILKSIVLNNLYGVDIMKEATEICKLRLFLKLVAQLDSPEQIEPLPDIDFNIRPGNALVGFSSVKDIREALQGDLVTEMALPDIKRRSKRAAAAFARFQRLQTETGADAAAIRSAKREVRRRTTELRDELDRHLASLDKPRRFGEWRASHQPFHWCAEFFGIVEGRGGFDVVIGNPPYIGMTKVRKRYALSADFATASCPDVYATVVERSVAVTRSRGRVGMIVPLSLTFGGRFRPLRDLLYARCAAAWFSSYDRRPSKLFSGGEQIRNTIYLGCVRTEGDRSPASTYATRLHRWFDKEERSTLFTQISYLKYSPNRWEGLIPKVGTSRLLHALETLLGDSYRFRHDLAKSFGAHELHFSQIGYNWLTFCVAKPPVTGRDGEALEQTQYGTIRFADEELRNTSMVLLNGRLLFLWWVAIGDSFHLTKGHFQGAPLGPAQLSPPVQRAVASLFPALSAAMEENTIYNQNAGKLIGNYNLARCRDITDRSDKMLLGALGLPNLWEEIELEYSQVVRKDFAAE